ncbi:MAG: hypothetical protein JWM27_1243, partial [Gemmatimonadetes bacterium]|nr:hypothetical protein [Gemmatimonadota bacterium]
MIAEPQGAAPHGGQSPETVDLVRRNVRDLLQRSPSFLALPAEKQREIAHETVKVASYLAEPDGVRGGGLAPSADPYAVQQALGSPPTLGGSQQPAPGQPPAFNAQGAQQGAQAAGAFLNAVNFPAFVSGLIDGVFHSIVTSSIEQMEAYGKLVADVAKTLDQFRDENVSVNQGRDHLLESHPDLFTLDMDTGDGEDGGGGPRVRLKDGVDEKAALAQVNQLPIAGGPLTSLDDDSVESKLVPAARTQLATSRQQLLATMVLMGINRIVVTDGRIAAKVMFDFQAKDTFKYRQSATQFDYDQNLKKKSWEGQHETSDEGRDSSSTYNKDTGGYDRTSRKGAYYSKGEYKYNEEPVLKLASASSTSIDASVQTKAQLMGSVEVNFKSDYLPLEKMADSFQIGRIQDAAKPGTATATGPRGAGTAPAA